MIFGCLGGVVFLVLAIILWIGGLPPWAMFTEAGRTRWFEPSGALQSAKAIGYGLEVAVLGLSLLALSGFLQKKDTDKVQVNPTWMTVGIGGLALTAMGIITTVMVIVRFFD